MSEYASSLPDSETLDPGGAGHLNLQTTYWNDGTHIIRVIYPEGNYVNYTYVAGNLTEVRKVAKTGSGLPDIVQTAHFPSPCTVGNFQVCNKPDYIIDANGNETDYTYDSNGNLLTMTDPSVTGGACRHAIPTPLSTRYYKNDGSNVVQADTPVYRLTSTSRCMLDGGKWGSITWGSNAWTSTGSCVGTAQETVTTNAYPTGSSSLATNLLPSSTSKAAGDGSLVGL